MVPPPQGFVVELDVDYVVRFLVCAFDYADEVECCVDVESVSVVSLS